MADRTITTTWTAVAAGPGNVTFEAQNPAIRWFVASSAPETAGLSAKPNTNISLSLDTGQNLYLRGTGVAVVLADNPVGL
jgi:hypothetical protein